MFSFGIWYYGRTRLNVRRGESATNKCKLKFIFLLKLVKKIKIYLKLRLRYFADKCVLVQRRRSAKNQWNQQIRQIKLKIFFILVVSEYLPKSILSQTLIFVHAIPDSQRYLTYGKLTKT